MAIEEKDKNEGKGREGQKIIESKKRTKWRKEKGSNGREGKKLRARKRRTKFKGKEEKEKDDRYSNRVRQ